MCMLCYKKREKINLKSYKNRNMLNNNTNNTNSFVYCQTDVTRKT